ncbi:hypothetical protein J3R83DRAFT_7949 [Lanmaoa asiatica]|nr:hypothetical protein J3R83DRAFT_7949 [Lanmaoa asiatica]
MSTTESTAMVVDTLVQQVAPTGATMVIDTLVQQNVKIAAVQRNTEVQIASSSRQDEEATVKAKKLVKATKKATKKIVNVNGKAKAGSSKEKGKEKTKADPKEKGKANRLLYKTVKKTSGEVKEYEPTVKEIIRTPVQDLFERVRASTTKATLDYALMTVMDENDMDRGPTMNCQQVNLRNVDSTFMRLFIRGIKEHGLQNKVIQNALNLDVHAEDIDISSLRAAQNEAYNNNVVWKPSAAKSKSLLYNGNHRFTYMQNHAPIHEIFLHYKKAREEILTSTSGERDEALQKLAADTHAAVMQDGVWLVRLLNLDFIQSHADQALIEHRPASNSLLPTHQDSDNDSLHTIMNVLLQTKTKQAHIKYIRVSIVECGYTWEICPWTDPTR